MKENNLAKHIDNFGDDHVGSSTETPLRIDAFELSDNEKISIIEENMRNILHTLGLDLTDDSLKGTPKRELQKLMLMKFLEV